MGEYAIRKSDGAEIKIGTCENMYYLRFDQRHLVKGMRGNVDPNDDSEVCSVRFRFPFPWEDAIQPGEFLDSDARIKLHNVSLPDGVDHSKVQFQNAAGVLISLPCPLSTEGKAFEAQTGLKFGFNGYSGDVGIVQQRKLSPTGPLALICQCGVCGTRFNLPTKADVAPIVEACLKEAERCNHPVPSMADPKWAKHWATIADRILAGYR